MNDKIVAKFGADISEVETEMIKGAKIVRYYKNAVDQVDKSDSSKGAGGFLANISKNSPKALGAVKQLAGAFGQAAAAAGLVPGIGIAAVGVAGVVAGVNLIRKHYEEIAENAKKVAEFMERAGKRNMDANKDGMTDEEKLNFARQQTKELEIQWRIAVRTGASDIEALEKREKYDEAKIELDKLIREAAKKRAEDEKKANEEHSRKADENFKADHARAEAKQKASDEEQKKIQELEELEEENARKEMALDAQVSEAGIALEEALIRAKKTGSIEDKISVEKIKKIYRDLFDQLHKQQKDNQAELDKLRYDGIWRYATLEQKITQAKKEGQAAQAKAEKDASVENLIALEKAKDKYRDLIEEAKKLSSASGGGGAGGDILGRVGLSRGADGKIRRGNVVVSEEDAARTIATRSRTERLDRESRRHRVESSFTREAQAAKNDLKNAINDAQVLIDVRDSLVPKKRT